MLLRFMFALLISTTATRAFSPHSAKACLRSTLVTMSATKNLTGKTCVSVKDSLDAHGSAKFLDGSWFLKGRNGREEYEIGPRIEGAQYFDIDDIASKGDLNPKNLPHMMPPKQLFAATMDAMGVTNDDHIILHGTKGCVSCSSWCCCNDCVQHNLTTILLRSFANSHTYPRSCFVACNTSSVVYNTCHGSRR
jgi:hypothetical protein